jgi:hypothetical protein
MKWKEMFAKFGKGFGLNDENEICDGEIYIAYNSSKYSINLEDVLMLLKGETAYPCSISEWTFHHISIPVVRVEIAMPIMIFNDCDPTIIQEFAEWSKFEGLSKDESDFLLTCNSRLQISGAEGTPKQQKIPGGMLLQHEQFAPKAKDTLDVIRILMIAVDGLAMCSSDGSWIRKSDFEAFIA